MNRTHKLVCIAMLTALSIVTNLVSIPLFGTNYASFTIAVCFFAGIYFGPWAAATVGFVGDLVAHFIFPHGDYNVFVALSTTLYGVVAALIYKLRLPKLAKLGISAAICYVVLQCGLNTFGLWLQNSVKIGFIEFFSMDKSLIEKSFWVYLGGRAPWSLITLVINVAIVAGLQHSAVIENLMNKIRGKDKVA